MKFLVPYTGIFKHLDQSEFAGCKPINTCNEYYSTLGTSLTIWPMHVTSIFTNKSENNFLQNYLV